MLVVTVLSLALLILQILFNLRRPVEVAARGFSFVINFSKTLALQEVWGFLSPSVRAFKSTCFHVTNSMKQRVLRTCIRLQQLFQNNMFLALFHQHSLPFCFREVWVITACWGLINSTSSHYGDEHVPPDVEKEFFRLQGDLYSLCRVKVRNLNCLWVFAWRLFWLEFWLVQSS